MKQVLQIAAGVFLGVMLILVVMNFQAIVDRVTGDDVTKKQMRENADANNRALKAAEEHEILMLRLKAEAAERERRRNTSR